MKNVVEKNELVQYSQVKSSQVKSSQVKSVQSKNRMFLEESMNAMHCSHTINGHVSIGVSVFYALEITM